MKHQFETLSVGEQEAEYSAKPNDGIITIPIHAAKSNLSKLVKRAAAGETIYIGAYGKPEAAIVAPESLPKKRPVSEAFGCMRGKMNLPPGGDDPLPDEIIDLFYNSKGLEEFEKK
jgi:antitoxin (DNA-binding transcriptional repressor) of toxin-antitoxin stability system